MNSFNKMYSMTSRRNDETFDLQYRIKREMSKEEKCKALEYSMKVAEIAGDVASDIGAIPVIGKTAGVFTSAVALISHISKGGMDLTYTAMNCDDIPFDEIKEIMTEKFNEMEKKLDEHTLALEAVSNLVSKTLSAVEKNSLEMKEGFNKILEFIENSRIEPIVSKISNFIQFFATEEKRMKLLPKDEFIAKLQETNNILLFLKDSRTPKGDSLQAPLYEIIDQKLAIPDHIDDKLSFSALYALYYGTHTYASVMLFLLEKYSYLADYHYQNANLEKFNQNFDLIKTTFRDFKHSLVGSDSEDKSLIGDVIDVFKTVLSKDFMREENKNAAEILSDKIESLSVLEKDIKSIVLPIIEDTPPNLVTVTFKKPDISTPIGDWKDGEEVRYAIQYQKENTFSKIGEWSKELEINGKACPVLKIPVDQKRRSRLIFRKIGNNKPELIGVLNKFQIDFKDIDRDLYKAAGRVDRQLAFKEAEVLVRGKANINSTFDHGRRPIHAAAEQGNAKLALRFLLSNNSTDIDIKDKGGYTPLHIAAESGQAGFIKLLLQNGADVNAKTNSDLSTPLHLASRLGFVKTVKVLLDDDSTNVNEKDANGFTPLHSSVAGGIRVLRALLSSGKADVNAKSFTGLTPLHLASMSNDVQVAQVVLKVNEAKVNEGDQNNMTALHFAAMAGNMDMVQFLLSLEETNINAKAKDNNWTPLHVAIYFKQENVAQELTESPKIDINSIAHPAYSPLHFACATGQTNIAMKLLLKGANLNERTVDGLTPIHLAALRQKGDLFQALVERGADIEDKTENGATPLHLAASAGRKDTVVYLIEKGANIKTVDNEGNTPLHEAAFKGELEIVQILFKADPDLIEMQNIYLETALHLASEEGITDIVKYLIKNGANTNAKNKDGITPLHIFAKTGELEMLNFLIKNGVDLNIRDNEGNTFFYHAAKSGSLNIIQYVIENKIIDVDAIDTYNENKSKSALHKAMCIAITNGKLNIIKYFVGTLKKFLCDPLHFASSSGELEIVKYLVEEVRMLPTHPSDEHSESNFCVALLNNHFHVVKYFVDKGVDINEQCYFWATSLHSAIFFRHFEIAMFLLQNGADITKMDMKGNTPLHYAVIRSATTITKYLIEVSKADINARNKDGDTPLHIAAKLDNLEMVKYLLEKEADTTLRNSANKTPADSAKPKVAEYFRYLKTAASEQLSNENKVRNIAVSYVTKNNFIRMATANNVEKRHVNQIGGSEEEVVQSKFAPIQPKADVLSTLFLLDLLIRKFTNERHFSTGYHFMSDFEMQGFALNITEKLEELLNAFSSNNVEETDFSSVHLNIYKALKSGDRRKIQNTLCSYVKMIPGTVSSKFESLLHSFCDTNLY